MNEYITKENKQKLEEELHYLSGQRRREILSEVEYAKSLGDLSENAEYHAARENQSKLEDRIRQIEHVLKHAHVVEKSTDGTVSIGSTVIVEKKDTKEYKTYTLVSQEDADSAEGRISYKSPLGEALYSKKVGQSFSVQTPKGLQEYTIVEVK
jgi:transcription elongation factor GreA